MFRHALDRGPLYYAGTAAERVAARASKYTFKQEMDEQARQNMFPQNKRLAAVAKS